MQMLVAVTRDRSMTPLSGACRPRHCRRERVALSALGGTRTPNLLIRSKMGVSAVQTAEDAGRRQTTRRQSDAVSPRSSWNLESPKAGSNAHGGTDSGRRDEAEDSQYVQVQQQLVGTHGILLWCGITA